jgi:MobC-like protein
MEKKKQNKNKWLHIRLTEDEFKKINEGFSRSTKRKRSQYIRAILLDKPITVYTRNKSLDEFLDELILLRRELNFIGHNFNQSVKKLHIAGHTSEIKTWAVINEKAKEIFFKKVDQIEAKITQIEESWSPE